jgi:hypothetical protein
MRQHETTPEPSPFSCITCHKRFKVKAKLEQHHILHSGIRMLAALHYVSTNTHFWTHFSMHFIMACNHCFVYMLDWLLKQCYVSTSASPGKETVAL